MQCTHNKGFNRLNLEIDWRQQKIAQIIGFCSRLALTPKTIKSNLGRFCFYSVERLPRLTRFVLEKPIKYNIIIGSFKCVQQTIIFRSPQMKRAALLVRFQWMSIEHLIYNRSVYISIKSGLNWYPKINYAHFTKSFHVLERHIKNKIYSRSARIIFFTNSSNGP